MTAPQTKTLSRDPGPAAAHGQARQQPATTAAGSPHLQKKTSLDRGKFMATNIGCRSATCFPVRRSKNLSIPLGFVCASPSEPLACPQIKRKRSGLEKGDVVLRHLRHRLCVLPAACSRSLPFLQFLGGNQPLWGSSFRDSMHP